MERAAFLVCYHCRMLRQLWTMVNGLNVYLHVVLIMKCHLPLRTCQVCLLCSFVIITVKYCKEVTHIIHNCCTCYWKKKLIGWYRGNNYARPNIVLWALCWKTYVLRFITKTRYILFLLSIILKSVACFKKTVKGKLRFWSSSKPLNCFKIYNSW